MHRRLFEIGALLLGIAVATAGRAAPIFMGLGDVAGGASVTVSAVSADGSTVVGTAPQPAPLDQDPPAQSFTEAFRWTQSGGWQGLGDFVGHNRSWTTDGSAAYGVSADGTTVVGYGNNTGGEAAFVWTSAGGMQPLAGGPFASSNFYRALGVSGDGSIVVGAGDNGSGGEGAFRWTSTGGFQQLLGGGVFSVATAISADGSTIAGLDASQAPQAFRWTGSGLVDLGVDFLPTAISADGSVMAGDFARWTQAGGVEGIGLRVHAMSADGSVIVGSFNTGPAAVWDPVHGTRDLQQMLAQDFGLDLTGWSLSDATGISADGRTIVGNGIDPGGQPESWLAFIPEPGTGLLLSAGLFGLAAPRRRRARSRRRTGQGASPIRSAPSRFA